MAGENSTERRKPQLRMQGKLYLKLAERAAEAARRNDPYEMDLAEIVSRAQVVRRGGGFQARIDATPDEIDRLAMWMPKSHRQEMYRVADNLREQMEAET